MAGLRFRELREDESFDPNTLAEGIPFTQAGFYGSWQRALGRKVRRIVAEENGSPIAYAQIVRYPLIRGKSYLYAPYGPVAPHLSDALLEGFKKELARIAREENAAFVRLDFTPPAGMAAGSVFRKAPAHTYHSAYFQPRIEWFLDLGKSEEELFAGMHEKTQYSIRTGEKRGVEVEIIERGFDAYFEPFYGLMQTTAARNGFRLHEKKYYEGIFRNLPSIPGSYLAIARYGGHILVIDLFIVFGGIANHVFGCSSNEERTRMPNYLAQWEAIRYAKKIGCVSYNFGGISADADPHAGWEGLTRFKRRFGGREVSHGAFFDLVLNPFWYWLYSLRKRIARR